jgi:hypothetical protein
MTEIVSTPMGLGHFGVEIHEGGLIVHREVLILLGLGLGWLAAAEPVHISSNRDSPPSIVAS